MSLSSRSSLSSWSLELVRINPNKLVSLSLVSASNYQAKDINIIISPLLKESSISFLHHFSLASLFVVWQSATDSFVALNCPKSTPSVSLFSRRDGALLTRVILAAVLTNFARWANRSVLSDSSLEANVGLMVQITEILALPDKAACRMRVSFEFRKGIWDALLYTLLANSCDLVWVGRINIYGSSLVSLEITLPRVSRLLLM